MSRVPIFSVEAATKLDLSILPKARMRNWNTRLSPILITSKNHRRYVATGGKQHRLRASYYRGGTSRAVFFRENDLPTDKLRWDPIFRGVLGSPDPNKRQLDGLGGGISSLSKICVIGQSKREGTDVDYNFVQVGVGDGDVDYGINCGNMATAVGPFAVDSGLYSVKAERDSKEVTVNILNVNTNKVIRSTFEVIEGEAMAGGKFRIDGVSGTAALVRLDFIEPAGAATGKLLPTHQPVDVIDGIEVSCIDVGNPCVFVRAEQLGDDLTIKSTQELDDNSEVLNSLESIRTQAAVLMGIRKAPEDVPASFPKICLVGPSTTHTLSNGTILEESEVDLLVRVVSMGTMHRAIPITVSLAVAAAAKIPGTVVAKCLPVADASDLRSLTIGHPTGTRTVGSTFTNEGKLESVTIFSTARRLMDGIIYWKSS